MAWNSAQTEGTNANIGTQVNTLLGTLTIKANTMPNVALVRIGAGRIIAVVVYEHS